MHGDEARYMMEAYDTNWMSTVGKNINEVEAQIAAFAGVKHAVALSSGTAALHLAAKLAGEKLYGTPGKMEEIKAICDKHSALIVEDAAESPGARYLFPERGMERNRFSGKLQLHFLQWK